MAGCAVRSVNGIAPYPSTVASLFPHPAPRATDRYDCVASFPPRRCASPPQPLRIHHPSSWPPAMAAASPPERKTFRIGAPTGFLPLSDDIVSTRGQRLPGLIQSRSATNLSDPSRFRKGRQSSISGRGAYEGPDDEESAHERRSGEGPNRPMQRLLSVSAEVLNSPQVRSMRLIGQNNPRYQW